MAAAPAACLAACLAAVIVGLDAGLSLVDTSGSVDVSALKLSARVLAESVLPRGPSSSMLTRSIVGGLLVQIFYRPCQASGLLVVLDTF